jgi:hypothetical protein
MTIRHVNKSPFSMYQLRNNHQRQNMWNPRAKDVDSSPTPGALVRIHLSVKSNTRVYMETDIT